MIEFVPLLPWIGLGLAIVIVALIVWRLSIRDGPFEFIDLFLDQQNNRASLAKVLIVWLLVLSSWVVIVKVTGLYEAAGIESLLLGLVTVFVGQITVLAAIDRWKGAPPEAPKPPEEPPKPPEPTKDGK